MKAARLLFFFILLTCISFSQTGGHTFGYEILRNPVGKIILKLKVEVADKGLYLGVSLYPPKVVNTLDEGRHFSFPVKQGIFTKDFEIDAGFEGGTFEAALWTNKIEKENCPPDDPVCQKLGYKHTGMASYIWGILKTR